MQRLNGKYSYAYHRKNVVPSCRAWGKELIHDYSCPRSLYENICSCIMRDIGVRRTWLFVSLKLSDNYFRAGLPETVMKPGCFFNIVFPHKQGGINPEQARYWNSVTQYQQYPIVIDSITRLTVSSDQVPVNLEKHPDYPTLYTNRFQQKTS